MYKGRKAIKQVAKQQGKSVIEVREEMNKAIDEAYDNRDKNKEWNKLFGDKKPSPEEFIEIMARKINKKEQ